MQIYKVGLDCTQRGMNIKSSPYNVGVILTLVISSLFPTVYAQNASSLVYPIDSKPYGLNYDQWAENWWKWFVSIPASISPADDPTGARCAQNQNDSNVWYLPATFGGKAERTCTIPSGKAILVTIIGIACNTKQDMVKTEAEFRDCVRAIMDNLRLATAQLDGVNIPNVEQYRITSSIFPVDLPKGAVWGAPPGPTNMSADAVYLMIPPLSKGEHTLHFSGQVLILQTPHIIRQLM
jgi:hypothetical protein